MFWVLVGPSALTLLLKFSLRLLVTEMEFTFGKVNDGFGYKPVSGWAVIFLPPLPYTLSSLNNFPPQWSFCTQIQPQQDLFLLKHYFRVQPICKSWASTVSHGSYIAGWSRPESGQWSK